ncbi:MAG: hypothetical protein FWF94_05355 [Oscillospiraceae bacterium]|nr:hypothetical protein [Oscillospiraceae bacterium]
MKNRVLSAFITIIMLMLVVIPVGADNPPSIVKPTAWDYPEPLRTRTAATVTELRSVMSTAIAGDEIVLTSEVYDVTGLSGTRAGVVQARDRSGTSENPIVLRSQDPANPARIMSTNVESGMLVHIWGGDYWIIQDIEIEGGQKGIMLDDTRHTIVRGNYIFGCGQEAIHIRDDSSFCQIIFNKVENTGLYRKGNGEAVYIGSANSTTGYGYSCDYNYIGYNVLGPGVTGESVDVKEFTTGNVIEHNVMYGTGIHGRNTPGETAASSFIILKGNNAIVRYNTGYREENTGMRAAIEVHDVESGWGYNNVVYDNTFDLDDESTWGPKAGDPTVWPTNASHPVFVVGIWSGSALVGENTVIPPTNTRSLKQVNAFSGATLTNITPEQYPQPDPRVPLYEPPSELSSALNISVVDDNGVSRIKIDNVSNKSVSTRGLFIHNGDYVKWQIPVLVIKSGECVYIERTSLFWEKMRFKRGMINFEIVPEWALLLVDANGNVLSEYFNA